MDKYHTVIKTDLHAHFKKGVLIKCCYQATMSDGSIIDYYQRDDYRKHQRIKQEG